MSYGQGNPSTVVFFISYWNASESSNLCGIKGTSNEMAGGAPPSPAMCPFLPKIVIPSLLRPKSKPSLGGFVSIVVNPPEKLPRLASYGVLYTAKDSTASVGTVIPKLPVTGSVFRVELMIRKL